MVMLSDMKSRLNFFLSHALSYGCSIYSHFVTPKSQVTKSHTLSTQIGLEVTKCHFSVKIISKTFNQLKIIKKNQNKLKVFPTGPTLYEGKYCL